MFPRISLGPIWSRNRPSAHTFECTRTFLDTQVKELDKELDGELSRVAKGIKADEKIDGRAARMVSYCMLSQTAPWMRRSQCRPRDGTNTCSGMTSKLGARKYA